MKQLEKPEQYITQIENDDNCIICLSKKQYVCKLKCRHIYCIECLKHYLELEKTKCCYCQKIIDTQTDKHLIYK